MLLNGAAAVRDTLSDLRSRDRFFKFKAGIVGAWALLSVTSIGIACPSGALSRSANLGARLVLAGDDTHPVFTIFNDGTEPWTDVTVIVNERYRAAAARVAPGSNLTLTPGQLLGADGTAAPSDLQVQALEVRTGDGDEVLMADGELSE